MTYFDVLFWLSIALGLYMRFLVSAAAAADLDPMGNGWYPEGFPAFCENHPIDCLPVRAEKISLAESLPLLEAVNRTVNKEITYRLDEGHPEKDVWTVSPA